MSETTTPAVEIHGHHRDVTGGALRAGVFGAMDGLVSNFALLAGVIGSGASNRSVVITGLAGLVAGACSMAAGEFTSVASQQELIESEIAVERRELTRNPQGEEHELALLYEGRGLAPALAKEVARELSRDPEIAWRVHVREELGVDPDDLPSPRVAALSSFAAFSCGALLPLLPLLLGFSSLLLLLAVSGVGLFATGAAVATLTSKPWWYGGVRQFVLGAAAAGVTFGIGSVVGTALG